MERYTRQPLDRLPLLKKGAFVKVVEKINSKQHVVHLPQLQSFACLNRRACAEQIRVTISIIHSCH